jgi:hypothetical protein
VFLRQWHFLYDQTVISFPAFFCGRSDIDGNGFLQASPCTVSPSNLRSVAEITVNEEIAVNRP